METRGVGQRWWGQEGLAKGGGVRGQGVESIFI